MQLEDCINFLLTNTQNKVFQYFKSQLNPYAITPVQYAILKCLWDKDGQTPTQIAKNISLDGSTITGIIDRMESKGLLQRLNNPDDRREIIIKLKEPGWALQEGVCQTIKETNDTVLRIFTEEEKGILQEYLTRIITSLT